MIFRSVCVCAFLLLCWSLITGLLVGDSGWELPLREQNNVLAQDYIYAPASRPKTVVAGTSLTARLPLTHLGRDSIYRLSFGGASVADALTIIEQVEPLPGRLLLETNLLVKAEDENFTAPLLHPVGVRVRQYVPAMRTRNRPISLLMAGLFYLKNGKQQIETPPEKERPVNQTMLDRRRTEYATAYDDEQLAEQLLSVGDRLEHLAKQGVEIILYEIPIHEELCDAPRARQLRAGVFRAFSGKYRILPTPDCSRYQTTDGHHLNEASATTFAAWVEDHFNR